MEAPMDKVRQTYRFTERDTMAVTKVATGRDYPQMIAETDHVEPAPRRVRATLGGEQIFDTTRARYVWEWP